MSRAEELVVLHAINKASKFLSLNQLHISEAIILISPKFFSP